MSPPPDFRAPRFAQAPEACFVAAPADGVAPDGFYATTNLPTYVQQKGQWQMPREPRMDAVVTRDDQGVLWAREPRRLRAGEAVLVAAHEDGADGVVVEPLVATPETPGDTFGFMRGAVSRERPIDYATMARLLVRERARGGHVVWVVGPAVVHARAREDLAWFIDGGYVGAMLAGNAVAVHDIESSLFGTTLGVGEPTAGTAGGHGMHMRAINTVRAVGSIEAAVARGLLRGGIMHACVARGIPYVLAGSIRDDGPLPGVLTDALAAQDAMRAHATRATMAVMIATSLHAIAFGNMVPAFVSDEAGALRELPTICVDSSEFVVSKLRDRGTHQAFGVVTNARDFLFVLRAHVERAAHDATPG
jgi:lysine-ketoglutarate reductase/saccharopine dehydrogenase-like protein (TIGR00300 family)